MTEIIQREFLGMDLVHGGTAVADRSHLVCIEFLPPVKGCIDGQEDRNHPSVFSMNRATLGKPGHQVMVIRSNNVLFFSCSLAVPVVATVTAIILAFKAVHLVPAVHGVPHTFDDDFPLLRGRQDCSFNFQHILFLSFKI